MTYQNSNEIEPVFQPDFLRFVYQALLDEGYTEEQLLDGLDLHPENLHDENFRLRIGQHESFILRALSITDDPHLSITLSDKYDLKNAGIVVLAALNSGKISNALNLIARYNKVITRTVFIRSVETDDQSVIEVDPLVVNESVIYFAVSSLIIFIDTFFSHALKGKHLVRRAEMGMKQPDGFEKVEDVIGFPMTFGHSQTRVYLNQTLLEEPTTQADPHTVRLLMEMSEKQLAQANAEESIVGAVTALLIKLISSPPKLDDAAKLLGHSPRDLRRKLRQSDTTYQNILDSVRLKLATKLLKQTEEPISNIAFELGFNNASHFGRAFKNWTGYAPSVFRDS